MLDGVEATVDNMANDSYKLQTIGHMYTKAPATRSVSLHRYIQTPACRTASSRPCSMRRLHLPRQATCRGPAGCRQRAGRDSAPSASGY